MTETYRWLKHYPNEVQPSNPYPKHNIAQFLVDAAGRFPHHTAVYFLGKTLSYSQVAEVAYRFANSLAGLNLRTGDRVAIMLPNCPQAVFAYYGVLMAGAIVVETNPLYKERELRHQLIDSGAVAIVVLDTFYPIVAKVMRQCRLAHIIVTSIQDYLPFPKNVLYGLKQQKNGAVPPIPYGTTDGLTVWSLKKLLSEASHAPVIAAVDAEKDIALLQYTGGTTGVSKGAMLTHYNLTVNALQTRAWCCYRSGDGEDRYLAALPFFHVFGMTVLLNLSVLRAGMLIVVPRYDIRLILRMIKKKKPTLFPGVPTMYIGLIHHPDVREYNISSIDICVSGSAPLPRDVQDRFEALTGGRLIEGYGLTEASPVTHANNVWGKRKNGSIGIPLPDTEARVVDPDTGEPLPFGEIGELAVRGPQVMKGYWNNEKETARAIKDGWLLTGDMAKEDEDGFFYIIERKKDIIIAGGFNIYPREVEEALFEHPDVKEAVAVGLPDEYRGETVKAYVVLREGAHIGEEELDAWCRVRLAAYKVPRRYEFRRELPKTIVGKVLRRKLLEEEIEKEKERKR